MKNSEMKTIIRHIDRLTRNLNARGRRRDANTMTNEHFAAIKTLLRPSFDVVLKSAKQLEKEFSSDSSLQRDIKTRDFQLVKKRIEALNRHANAISYCMEKILKTVNDAIKIQRG